MRIVTIGRAATADIVLADPTVSSIHARIEPHNGHGGHRLIDCHSRNGTRINNRTMSEHDLALGDRIRIGATELVYVSADAPLEAAAPPPAEGTTGEDSPAEARAPLGTLVDDDTSTLTVAPDDFDIDFLEPRTVAAERAGEAQLERRLTALYRAAKTLTPIGDRSPVAPRFIKLAQDVLGAMRVAVLHLSGAGAPAGAPVVAAEVRPPAESFSSVPPEIVVIREAKRTGRALLYRRPATRATERSAPASAIAVPLPVENEPGLVAYADVFDPWPPFTVDDLRLLGVLARHAATCIVNQRLQESLLDLNRNLEEQVQARTRYLIDSSKLAAVGTLAAGIAHEFNNVLAVIMGNAELARDAPGISEDARGQVETILGAARRSKDVVRHLLTFARRRDPKRESVNLVELVESTLRLVAADFARTGIHVRRSFAAVPPVLGEPSQLSLVILNVVKNARDAIAQKGGGELHVAIRRRTPSGEGGVPVAVLEVRDTGVGMAPEVKKHAFEPFFTTKEPGQGTGLGLSTAYGIVMNHGGTIEVDTEPGVGSSFRIVLPLETPEVVEIAVPDLSVEELTRPASRPVLHILVCDDDAAVRATLAAMIKRLKHQATLVASGAEALKAIDGARFDLVLVDYGMAGMNGLELRSEILKRLPDQKIVLITGNIDIEDLAARNNFAATDFLKKPFSFREIADIVARAAAPPP